MKKEIRIFKNRDSSIRLVFVFGGDFNVTTFSIDTNWKSGKDKSKINEPIGLDLSFHSTESLSKYGYEEDLSNPKCLFLNNKPCHCVTSGLVAQALLEDFLELKNPEEIWLKLEKLHDDFFREI